jgi:dTDP-4-amino-4,6-dideoxygalactose transaminase
MVGNLNIPLFKPKYRNKEIFHHISDCIFSGWTNQGFKTLQFEEFFKKYSNFKNAHFVSSATAGLNLAVKILKDKNNWKDGDEIITTPITFVSTNHSIIHNNLCPVFADVDNQLCLDLESIKKMLSKKTKAVMFVGMGGNIGQYYDILEFCRSKNLKLILDAAHMMGTKVNDIQVGTDSDACIFSFHTVKNLPTADSGMLCFKEDENDELARNLSWMGINKPTYKRTNKNLYSWDYDVLDFGHKYHSNSIMASFGLVGLKYLDKDNQKRRDICDSYDKHFNFCSIKHNDLCKSSRHLYQIVVENRDDLIYSLASKGIQCGVHYKPNFEYKIYKKYKKNCKNASFLGKRIVSLPLNLFLTKQQVNFIIKTIKNENCFSNSIK